MNLEELKGQKAVNELTVQLETFKESLPLNVAEDLSFYGEDIINERKKMIKETDEMIANILSEFPDSKIINPEELIENSPTIKRVINFLKPEDEQEIDLPLNARSNWH